MKQYLKQLFIAFALLSITIASIAQPPASEVWAGGEITVDFAGDPNAPCDGLMPYFFTLKFYRDCTPLLQDEKTIYAWSASNNNYLQEITLNVPIDRGQIDNLCIKGDPVCTVGRWYTTSKPVNLPFPANDWRIFYGRIPMGGIGQGILGRRYNSPANDNLADGQTFYIETTLRNLRYCGEVSGVEPTDVTDTVRRVNVPFNRSPRWITPDIVETFCDGKSYEYRLPVVDDDAYTIDLDLDNTTTTDTLVIRDSLKYEYIGASRRYGSSVQYLTNNGFNSSTPFPSSTPITMDTEKGIMKFSPSLAPGQSSFIGTFNFRITEYRTFFRVDSTCLKPGGGCLPNERTPVVRKIETGVIGTTIRQMRFIIDKNCNNQLPEFESDVFNNAESAWEFDCADTVLDFRMTKPMLYRDAIADPKWLSMYRGKPGQPQDDDAIGIDSIVPLNRNALDEFTRFRVYLYKPIGPGNYTLFPKPNKRPEGIKNRCGFALEEGSVDIPIYVNTDYTYVFGDKDKLKEFCYPADLPFRVDALAGQGKLSEVAYLFTWAFVQFNNNAKRDSFYRPESKYDIIVPEDINGDLDFLAAQGDWAVGVGLDFGYTYNGVKFEAVCYDEDEFDVIFYQNDPVEIPDYDLCAQEPWPLINLDSMTIKHAAENYVWTYFNAPLDRWDTIGGNSNNGKKNDFFQVASIGSGLGKPFIITSEVELEAGKCYERDTFTVIKQLVDVDINPGGDSIICPDFQYTLTNTSTYLVPDSMSYQWFLNGVALDGADSNSVLITEEGNYKLVVTKNTVNSSCTGADSVFITIADSLGIPEPVCTQVTFKDGDIEQTFFIPPLEGAEDFDVRQVSPVGIEGPWEKPNQGALDHVIRGKQLRLEVRGINTEVPEDAPCYYGPIGLAAACNAVVKPVNVFTPNGDGINEFLRFDLLEVFPGSPLLIFNRWGELIYESDSYENDWDGEDYKEGTYFYVLDINDESQGTLKGTFTILR